MESLQSGSRMTLATIALLIVASPASAQICGDADSNGVVSVTDGVQVLRAAADLSSNCTLAACDTDHNGMITIVDGVNVLRAAASLPGTCDDFDMPTPTPIQTPSGPATDAIHACDDDCRATLQVCGDDTFSESYDSVAECTEDCVATVEDFAVDATDFNRCVDAQAHFIECCTNHKQCGDIPEGCGSEFGAAADACGGQFGGCPLIFF
jgi:hypothetical protein